MIQDFDEEGELPASNNKAENFLFSKGAKGWRIISVVISGISLCQWTKESLLDFCKKWAVANPVMRYKEGDWSHLYPEIEHAISFSDVAMALRCAVSYSTFSPPIFEVMEILGKEEVLKRLENVIVFNWRKNETP